VAALLDETLQEEEKTDALGAVAGVVGI